MDPKILANLRDVLAKLYSEKSSIRRLVADSGIDLSRIDFDSAGKNILHSVLTEAEKSGQIDALLDVVERSEYGNNEEFRRACDIYRRSTGQTRNDQNKHQYPNVANPFKKYILIFTVTAVVILAIGIIWTILTSGAGNVLPPNPNPDLVQSYTGASIPITTNSELSVSIPVSSTPSLIATSTFALDQPDLPTMTPTSTPVFTKTLVLTDNFEVPSDSWLDSSTLISSTLVMSGYDNSKFAIELAGNNPDSAIYRPLPGDFAAHNSYQVSVWCKAEARAPCALSWEDRPANKNPGYENFAEQTIAGNGEWQPLSICKKLTQNETRNMFLSLHARPVPTEFPVNRVQYDNLQVEQVSQCVRPISTSATLTWTSDFEEDLEIWKKCGDEKDRDVSTLVQPGYNSDHAVQVTYRQPVDGKPVDQTGICRYVYDPNPGDPPSFRKGEFYRASVWCKAELGDECWLGFTNLPYNDSGYDNLAGEVIKGNGDWQLLSVCKAIFKDSRMSVHIYAKKDTHLILYDDLQVEKVDRCP